MFWLHTLQAQVTILLREFAHSINAIPSDKGAGANKSMDNTQTILDKCRDVIKNLK
jgi:hypothetical protein